MEAFRAEMRKSSKGEEEEEEEEEKKKKKKGTVQPPKRKTTPMEKEKSKKKQKLDSVIKAVGNSQERLEIVHPNQISQEFFSLAAKATDPASLQMIPFFKLSMRINAFQCQTIESLEKRVADLEKFLASKIVILSKEQVKVATKLVISDNPLLFRENPYLGKDVPDSPFSKKLTGKATMLSQMRNLVIKKLNLSDDTANNFSKIINDGINDAFTAQRKFVFSHTTDVLLEHLEYLKPSTTDLKDLAKEKFVDALVKKLIQVILLRCYSAVNTDTSSATLNETKLIKNKIWRYLVDYYNKISGKKNEKEEDKEDIVDIVDEEEEDLPTISFLQDTN